MDYCRCKCTACRWCWTNLAEQEQGHGKDFDETAYLQRRAVNEAKLTDAGVYAPQMEHDACGVGFVAARDGKPNRAVVESAIEALQAIWHRGAVDADGMTGDGAGIHIEIPRDFFIEHIARTGHDDDGGRLAVGMVFPAAYGPCRTGTLSMYCRAGNTGGWA